MSELRPESYPPLPDWGEAVVPHPDGRPWRKACGMCAFRRNDPQGLGFGGLETIRDMNRDEKLFYCVHREDGDHMRICASFAACAATEQLRKQRASLARLKKAMGCPDLDPA